MDTLAKNLVASAPERFIYFPSKWRKFDDGTDNIKLGGFDENLMMPDADVLFLASFNNNDTTLSQLHALTWIAESGFVSSLTILLAFLPTATMERSLKPGRIATCNTTAKLLSHLPATGGSRKTRVMIYDVHAPPAQFFFTGNCYATLHSACPLVAARIRAMSDGERIDCVAFPDEGACKRFGGFFKDEFGTSTTTVEGGDGAGGIELVTCCKKRNVGAEGRVVEISDGDPRGRNVLIMDDLIQTGGTLHEVRRFLDVFDRHGQHHCHHSLTHPLITDSHSPGRLGATRGRREIGQWLRRPCGVPEGIVAAVPEGRQVYHCSKTTMHYRSIATRTRLHLPDWRRGTTGGLSSAAASSSWLITQRLSTNGSLSNTNTEHWALDRSLLECAAPFLTIF
jgi:phosphoribosylpyrophosphate synthetase